MVLCTIRPVRPNVRDGQNAFGLQGHRHHRVLAAGRSVGLHAHPRPDRGSGSDACRQRRGARHTVPLQRGRAGTAHAVALQQHGQRLRAADPYGCRCQRLRRMAARDGQSRRDRRRDRPGREIRPRRPGRQHVGQHGRNPGQRHRRRRQRLRRRHLRVQLHQQFGRAELLAGTHARHPRGRYDRRGQQQRHRRQRHRGRLGPERRREDHVVRDTRQIGIGLLRRRPLGADPRIQIRGRQRRCDLPEQLGIHRRDNLRNRLEERHLFGADPRHPVFQQICRAG